MKDIVVIGASGFAKEVSWLIERVNENRKIWNIIGYIDNDLPIGAKVGSYYVIGSDNYVINSENELSIAFGIGSSAVRKKLVNQYSTNKKIQYPTLCDPAAIISSRNEIGMGNIICAGSILTVDIHIGHYNIINLDCTIGHDSILGSYITMNPSVNISGNVIIHNCVEIGTGTQVIQGKQIGQGTIIGAGAVVAKDLPENCTAVGLPAKPIKFHKQPGEGK